MDENRKRMPWWGWAAVSLALVYLYLLSFGLVVTIANKAPAPKAVALVIQIVRLCWTDRSFPATIIV